MIIGQQTTRIMWVLMLVSDRKQCDLLKRGRVAERRAGRRRCRSLRILFVVSSSFQDVVGNDDKEHEEEYCACAEHNADRKSVSFKVCRVVVIGNGWLL